jgi:3-isopropylmalate dehydrogenase
MFVDALTMQMVRAPEMFDVIVTNNMFGDIVTDLGAALQGGLGVAASGNIHPGKISLFEPIHGSAPKYTGQDVANPVGAILTAAMMLEYLGFEEPARRIEAAVEGAVRAGEATRDLGGKFGTKAAGEAVLARV